MIASMMMYARPETQTAHGRYWALIREELTARQIPSPQKLTNDGDPFDVWTEPDLVFSQTCGMPYRKRLSNKVRLIGTPDYGLPGCPPGYYNSVLVVRADDPRTDPSEYRGARFAYNEPMSQSGFAAPYAFFKPLGFWFEDRRQSYGHVHSARAVAEKRADIAALDALSWVLMQRYDGFASDLRVLATTGPTPGLPYITGPDADADAMYGAVSAAIARLSDEDRTTLCLRGLIRIPTSDYLAIPNPPKDAG